MCLKRETVHTYSAGGRSCSPAECASGSIDEDLPFFASWHPGWKLPIASFGGRLLALDPEANSPKVDAALQAVRSCGKSRGSERLTSSSGVTVTLRYSRRFFDTARIGLAPAAAAKQIVLPKSPNSGIRQNCRDTPKLHSQRTRITFTILVADWLQIP